MQRMMGTRTLHQFWAAHAEFWRRAMEDYSEEYLVMGRLAAGVTTKVVSAAQCATNEASEEMSHSKAA
jgi:hypothetical protein